MARDSWRRRAGLLLGVAAVLMPLGAALADGPPSAAAQPPVVDWGNVGQLPFLYGQAEPIKLSDYWLGLDCRPVPPVLRAQLKLPEDQGLVVQQIMPESPAAAAGIEQYDVLVKADGKPLRKLQDLIDAVDASKDKDLALEFIRGGKSTKIEAKPAKRPESQLPLPGPGKVEELPHEWMHRYFDQFVPGEEGKPWRFRFWGPGTILPPDAKPGRPMPGNLQVTMTRSGDDPVKIVVKRGDEKWEVTEGELGKLPDDVRPHVERMLGRTPPPEAPEGWSGDFEFVPDWPGLRWQFRPEGRLEQRMEEMNRRIDELRKSLDQMRERRPRRKDAPKSGAKTAPRPDEPKDESKNKPDKV